MYSGIQTSKVTLDTICMQNAQVHHYATRTKNIGKEFTSEYLDRPEKFFNKDHSRVFWQLFIDMRYEPVV